MNVMKESFLKSGMRLFATVEPYRWSILLKVISGSIPVVKRALRINLRRRSECLDIAMFVVKE